MRDIIKIILITLSLLFWIFRVYVCLMYSMQNDFLFKPYNFNMEIIILFLTIPCVIALLRRNFIGNLVYFSMDVAYYGTSIYEKMKSFEAIDMEIILGDIEILILMFGIMIPLCIMIEFFIGGRKIEGNNDNWFYDNEKYDRKLDSRIDRNQYKIK